jgi:hypothetical protein
MINNTPPGQLAQYLIGDLGVAKRHLQRLGAGSFPASRGILLEIERSVDDCIARIQRDVEPLDKPEGTD